MAPSASKQKRLAEKAAKKNANIASGDGDASPSNSTPAGSVNGASTPLTSMSGINSKAGSHEDLSSMAKLNIATDRRVSLYSRMLDSADDGH
jgi:ATP-binding cassette subfamily F protein 2